MASTKAPINEKRAEGSDEHIERRSESNNSTSNTAKAENPLARDSANELTNAASQFAKEHQLEHLADDIRKGAFLAQNPSGWNTMDVGLTEDERDALRDEVEHSELTLPH